jgi:ABC-type uncharacterized transport system auxiliary subunit
MKIFKLLLIAVMCGGLLPLAIGCASVPVKKYLILNYVPTEHPPTGAGGPYSFTVRVKEFDIEDAYARSQIVYRKSPYELQYYFYQLWAVKPKTMITDLVFKHLASSRLVSHVVRRYDEEFAPQYELSGRIEALEEYDSEKLWFAHMAINISLVRLSDGRVMYSRRFDNRKRVYQHEPEYVVREMSATLEYVMNQVIIDLDRIFSREAGYAGNGTPDSTAVPQNPPDSTSGIEDLNE